jgi:GPI mannosyltransferase 1 subunit M
MSNLFTDLQNVQLVTKMMTITGLKKHLITGLVIRLALIIYGEIQDQISEVPYTDIDYKVVTDASRHIYNLGSPFQRHTYRYTPILAILLIPNIYFHQTCGKILFVAFDLIIAVIIKNIVLDEIHLLVGSQQYLNGGDGKIKTEKKSLINTTSVKQKTRFFISKKESRINMMMNDRQKFEKMGNFAAQVWIYNPLTMVIATRGNGDAISCALVLLSIYYLLKSDDIDSKNSERFVILGGIFHGLAIHFRLYPIFFSLAFYLFLSNRRDQVNGNGSIFDCILKPNRKQILLVMSVVITLAFITGIFFIFFKYEFIHESILYHFMRKDTRHNFSLFFYIQYLSSVDKVNIFQKLLISMPQLILIILISFHFTKTRQTLQFALLLIAFIIVTYNPVITSQYFVWFLSLLPLSINNFRNLSLKQTLILPSLWFLGQGIWLLFAYFLEFKGINSFDFIWLASVIFFVINIVIVQILIVNYDDLSVKIK